MISQNISQSKHLQSVDEANLLMAAQSSICAGSVHYRHDDATHTHLAVNHRGLLLKRGGDYFPPRSQQVTLFISCGHLIAFVWDPPKMY